MLDLLEMDLHFFRDKNLPDEAYFFCASVALPVGQFQSNRGPMIDMASNGTPLVIVSQVDWSQQPFKVWQFFQESEKR